MRNYDPDRCEKVISPGGSLVFTGLTNPDTGDIFPLVGMNVQYHSEC